MNPLSVPIGCETCGARPGQRCRTGAGRAKPTPHVARRRAIEQFAGQPATVTDLAEFRARKMIRARIDTPLAHDMTLLDE